MKSPNPFALYALETCGAIPQRRESTDISESCLLAPDRIDEHPRAPAGLLERRCCAFPLRHQARRVGCGRVDDDVVALDPPLDLAGKVEIALDVFDREAR